ncbi:MAG: VapC toxin family PIN domain ribonuclease, partial [Dehalococcoidia bacterium]|nr:VapC toxin family PIN domain ribonuclease [Dehalococcoidia bacterium]
ERDGFWEVFQDVSREAGARGTLIHAAHIVALMRQYEVATIWTSDRDFRRFDGIRVVNPLVARPGR